MGADSAPDDVTLVGDDRVAVLERRSAVVCPGHLVDAGCAPDALDPKSVAEPRAAVEVLDELGDRGEERGLLPGREGVEVFAEAREPGERRQRSLGAGSSLSVLRTGLERVE